MSQPTNQTARPEEGAGHDLRLASYGLNDQLVANYETLGITALHAWQAEALALDGVLEGGRALVYVAPTSGGKSLVAEVLLLRRLLAGGAGGLQSLGERRR